MAGGFIIIHSNSNINIIIIGCASVFVMLMRSTLELILRCRVAAVAVAVAVAQAPSRVACIVAQILNRANRKRKRSGERRGAVREERAKEGQRKRLRLSCSCDHLKKHC